MNFLFHNTQTKRRYVYATVGAGSLLSSNINTVDDEATENTKPAHASIAVRDVVTCGIDFWDTRADCKYVTNYFVNGLEIQHVNEPFPPRKSAIIYSANDTIGFSRWNPTSAKINGGVL
jgi:hypothetical protein